MSFHYHFISLSLSLIVSLSYLHESHSELPFSFSICSFVEVSVFFLWNTFHHLKKTAWLNSQTTALLRHRTGPQTHERVTHTRTRTHSHIHAHTHTYTRAHARTHTHRNTHAHAQEQSHTSATASITYPYSRTYPTHISNLWKQDWLIDIFFIGNPTGKVCLVM